MQHFLIEPSNKSSGFLKFKIFLDLALINARFFLCLLLLNNFTVLVVITYIDYNNFKFSTLPFPEISSSPSVSMSTRVRFSMFPSLPIKGRAFPVEFVCSAL